MEKSINVINLTKEYEDFRLDSISFSLPKGSIMGFVGENGAGKTTTIKLLLNMIEKESGEIQIFNLQNTLNEKVIKQQLGSVFDQHFFCDDWTVGECEKAMAPFYNEWDKAKFKMLVERFGLDFKKKVKSLSKGMQMKLMLATAFSHNAKLLLLDEPTSGLAPSARNELMQILCEYASNSENSVFFSTHIISDLEKIADYITFIHKGKIIYTGTKDNMKKEYLKISGTKNSLSDNQDKIIGFSQTSDDFNGMIKTSDARCFLSANFKVESICIEDIIIYTTKDGTK